jgi:CRP-like cAMP-binding protein
MQPNWIDQLSEAPRRAMQAAMIQRSYPKGAMVYSREEAPPGLCVVRSGSAMICLDAANGRRMLVKIVRHNEIFGETVAHDGNSAAISLEARSDLTVSIVPTHALAKLKPEFPEIELALGRVATFYLRALFDMLLEQALATIDERVAARLALVCRVEGEPGAEPGKVVIDVSQAELAMMLCASRQSINAVLGRLEAKGAITRRFRSIECRPDLLRSAG